MSPGGITQLFANKIDSEIRVFAADELVFSQGDPADYIYAVERGEVRLERFTEEGRAVVIHSVRAGEGFAEAALFSDIYHCDAITTCPSSVYFFPKQEITANLQQSPATAMQYISLLSNQVKMLRSRLELRNILSARDRLVQFLHLNVEPNGVVSLFGNLKMLAAELGMAHETLYRELARLENDRIIERSGSKIKIL